MILMQKFAFADDICKIFHVRIAYLVIRLPDIIYMRFARAKFLYMPIACSRLDAYNNRMASSHFFVQHFINTNKSLYM